MGKGSPGSCHKGDTATGSLEVQYEACGRMETKGIGVRSALTVEDRESPRH